MNLLPLQYITIAFIILFIITLILVITATISRLRHSRQETYLKLKKETFYPLIFDFLEGKVRPTEITNIIGPSLKDWDIFEQQTLELMDDLSGNEKQKLIELLRTPVLMERYARDLRSARKKKIIKACRYYEHIQFSSSGIAEKLERICRQRTHLEAVAAASAMTGSPDAKIRAKAVLLLAQRRDVSAMTMLDILYKFHEPESDHPETEGRYLEKIIRANKVPPKNKAILIKGLADLDFIVQAPFIYQFFVQNKTIQQQASVIEAAIYALGCFHYEKARPLITKFLNHPSPSVRKTCITALAKFREPEDVENISNYLQDQDLSVRLNAVKALHAFGQAGREKIQESFIPAADYLPAAT